jgi:hypothetical protein
LRLVAGDPVGDFASAGAFAALDDREDMASAQIREKRLQRRAEQRSTVPSLLAEERLPQQES